VVCHSVLRDWFFRWSYCGWLFSGKEYGEGRRYALGSGTRSRNAEYSAPGICLAILQSSACEDAGDRVVSAVFRVQFP
jgi:hypothetical protein